MNRMASWLYLHGLEDVGMRTNNDNDIDVFDDMSLSWKMYICICYFDLRYRRDCIDAIVCFREWGVYDHADSKTIPSSRDQGGLNVPSRDPENAASQSLSESRYRSQKSERSKTFRVSASRRLGP